ncbi:hypothetical protein AALO_G00088840 [Alosa alosa]|uniref:Uncharacterized protein n=1 Tax=Alosa alosa TaxID=278164 RepID=A0AAV6GZ76_9TELE|nr:hypothetical protein AALO_G00088840 [Alosa alosa]
MSQGAKSWRAPQHGPLQSRASALANLLACSSSTHSSCLRPIYLSNWPTDEKSLAPGNPGKLTRNTLQRSHSKMELCSRVKREVVTSPA